MLTLTLIGIMVCQGIYSTHQGITISRLKNSLAAKTQECLDSTAKLGETQESLEQLAKIKHHPPK